MRKILLTTALLLFSSGASHAEETGDHEINLVVNAPEPEISLNLFGNTTGSLTTTNFDFDMDAQSFTGSNPLLKRIQRSLGMLAFSATGLPNDKTRCTLTIASQEGWRLVNATATQTGAGEPGRPISYTIHANSPAHQP